MFFTIIVTLGKPADFKSRLQPSSILEFAYT